MLFVYKDQSIEPLVLCMKLRTKIKKLKRSITKPNQQRRFQLENWLGAARTQTPTATNYDVDSATWADLRVAPLLSAMEVTNLGHEPS